MSDSGIEQIMALAPVIPVIVIDRVEDAAPLAEALVAGGLPVLEVTLRTPPALDAMKAMKQVAGAVVGAGTVLNPRMLDDALHAGAEFIVSPGLTDSLGEAAVAAGIPFLPGIANAGDIMRGMDMGLTRFKFFPAATSVHDMRPMARTIRIARSNAQPRMCAARRGALVRFAREASLRTRRARVCVPRRRRRATHHMTE